MPKAKKPAIKTIKLSTDQIEALIGASRLGITLESWVAHLTQTAINSFDTHSQRYTVFVGETINDIKKQTGVDHEYYSYANDKEQMAMLEKFVYDTCEKYQKEEESFTEKNAKHEYTHRNKSRGWLIILIIGIVILTVGGGLNWFFQLLFGL